LGLALYFVAPLLPPVWVRAATALLVAAAGAVLALRAPRAAGAALWARRAAGVALTAVALVLLVREDTGSAVDWMPFSDERLAHATAAGRPVLLDFTAAWCLPCREMEHTTFRAPRFAETAAHFVTLKVDVTADDHDANALMSRFDVAGVP